MSEVVIDKGKYRLPDNAIDLEEWLRDGLEVYNLFVAMKPLFFQMLEAHGGTFVGSSNKANEDRHRYRIVFGSKYVEDAAGHITDGEISATLERRDDESESVA